MLNVSLNKTFRSFIDSWGVWNSVLNLKEQCGVDTTEKKEKEKKKKKSNLQMFYFLGNKYLIFHATWLVINVYQTYNRQLMRHQWRFANLNATLVVSGALT